MPQNVQWVRPKGARRWWSSYSLARTCRWPCLTTWQQTLSVCIGTLGECEKFCDEVRTVVEMGLLFDETIHRGFGQLLSLHFSPSNLPFYYQPCLYSTALENHASQPYHQYFSRFALYASNFNVNIGTSYMQTDSKIYAFIRQLSPV